MSLIKLRLCLFLAATAFTKDVGAQIQISGLSSQCYTRPGDVLIGLAIPTTEPGESGTCTQQASRRYIEMLEAFVYAINEINSDTLLLPNITLGFVILDTCDIYRMITAQALYMIADDASGSPWKVAPCSGETKLHYDVIAAIGDDRSYSMLPLALVMSAAEIPVIGTYQTSDELSDANRFGYLVKLSPPDRYQTEAILQLLARHNWTYFSLIYEEGSYGENGAKYIMEGAEKYGLCIEHSMLVFVDHTVADIDKILHTLVYFTKSRAVVLFLLDSVAELLFVRLPEAYFNYFVWIGSDGVESGAYGPASNGILSINLAYGSNPDFESYYRSLTPFNNQDDPWFALSWPDFYNCTWAVTSTDIVCDSPSCSTTEVPCQLFENTTAPADAVFYGSSIKHIDTVYTLAHGLQLLIQSSCPNAADNSTHLQSCISGPDYLESIKKVSFEGYTSHIEFDENGEIRTNYVIRQYSAANDTLRDVGMWDTNNGQLELYPGAIDWSLFQELGSQEVDDLLVEIPESVCSQPCEPRQYLIQKQTRCCWDCKDCSVNEIVVNNSTACELCIENTWPDDDTATRCEVIPPLYLRWTDSVGIVLVCINTLGLSLTMATTALLIRHRNIKLIKASSRELMAVILVGIHLAFLSTFTTVMTPSAGTCFLRDLGFSLSVTLIYAPLLMKTVRVYRIFKSGLEGKKKLSFISTKAQLLSSFVLIGLQITLTIIVSLVKPSEAITQMPVATEKLSELFCTLPPEVLTVLIAFNLVILTVCAVFGFLTRKLPENFNESWFIFISVATTIFLWLAFFPTYFSSFYAYRRAVLLGASLMLNGYITLLCLFLPKLYAVYFVEDERLKLATLTVHPAQASVAPMATSD